VSRATWHILARLTTQAAIRPSRDLRHLQSFRQDLDLPLVLNKYSHSQSGQDKYFRCAERGLDAPLVSRWLLRSLGTGCEVTANNGVSDGTNSQPD